MNPDNGICRLPGSGRQQVGFFWEACEAKQETQKEETMEPKTKVCQTCKQKKPLEEFYRNRWGYTDHCKECIKEKKEKKWKDAENAMLEKIFGKPEPEKTLEDTVLEFAVADAREEARKHNEKLQKDAAFITDLPTPILVAELQRRGWSGTLVQHNELTI